MQWNIFRSPQQKDLFDFSISQKKFKYSPKPSQSQKIKSSLFGQSLKNPSHKKHNKAVWKSGSSKNSNSKSVLSLSTKSKNNANNHKNIDFKKIDSDDSLSRIFIKQINKTEDNTTAGNRFSSCKKQQNYMLEMVSTLREIKQINKANLQMNTKLVLLLMKQSQDKKKKQLLNPRHQQLYTGVVTVKDLHIKSKSTAKKRLHKKSELNAQQRAHSRLDDIDKIKINLNCLTKKKKSKHPTSKKKSKSHSMLRV